MLCISIRVIIRGLLHCFGLEFFEYKFRNMKESVDRLSIVIPIVKQCKSLSSLVCVIVSIFFIIFHKFIELVIA